MNQHTYKYKTGLVVGKFYPPHRGHKYLIDTATSQCEDLTVILCWNRSETIPGSLRASWLHKIHPKVQIKVIEDTKLADDDSKGWAQFTLDILGYVPDAVFTSEAYGDPYASFMGSVHVLVDRDRTVVPISGTLARKEPMKYAKYLEPCVRGFFTRRVSLVGAESTGKTTLAQAIARHYNTFWIPEYGRFYSEGKLSGTDGHNWESDEFENIARAQNILEDTLAERSNGLVICDTDSFATSVWHERYMGVRSPVVDELAKNRVQDLYILTGDEIPWENDGTRDGKEIRHWMHERFVERLKEENKRYIIVSGTLEERLSASIKAIDQLGTLTYEQ